MTTGRRIRWRRVGPVAGWSLTAALALVTVNRAVRPEHVPLLIGLQGVAVFLLAPALPLAGLALWRRRRVMAAVAAAITVVQLGWIGAATGWHGPQPAPGGSVPLRVVTANVLMDNPAIPELADELLASGADVILLQEITPEIAATLATTPLWTAYPGRVDNALPGFHGSLILSRLPITGGRAFDVAGRPMTRADLQTAAGPVRVVDVHAVAPVNRENTAVWLAQMEALATMSAPAGSALVMAGDFNATVDHAPFQRVLAAGKRDAFLEAGSGYGATWPSWGGPTVPVMRLDHVLVGDGVAVVSVDEAVSAGSDHRRLVAELALTSRS
ncbi:endonuclease/exonuclease/phosphatase family protein [Nakamurella deserti]|uniref:endonuclease/exonuclease/phosphatase family protein n=1 Tax=Nakamurella deserti TaxID=2164074 RepID=UPI000DBE8C3F|nr:endonuclease/exonuclease/phosphatase family protein [Nakamurella deserti]